MGDNATQLALKLIDQMIVIQGDWHYCLDNAVSQFYIGVKCKAKTEFFDVQSTKLIDEYSLTVLPGEGSNINKSTDFSVSLEKNKYLVVKFKETITTFKAPQEIIAGFASSLHAVDLSRTGAFVVADVSGNLIVYDSSNERKQTKLTGHVMDIYRCLFFPSGVVILAGGMDMAVRIWTADSGNCVRTMRGHKGAVTGLGIFGQGKQIVSCSNDGTARVWNCSSGETVETFSFDAGKCVDLGAASDGTRFAVICESNVLCIVNLDETRSQHRIQLPCEPTAICLSSEDAGEVAFVGFQDGHIAAYSTEDQRLIGEIEHNRGYVSCIRHADGRLLVSFIDGSVLTYQVPTLATLAAGDSSLAPEDIIKREYVLTGAHLDAVFAIGVVKNNVITCCRDMICRLYSL